MAVSFNVIKKAQPGVSGGGNYKYYAVNKNSGTIDVDTLCSRIADMSTLSKIDCVGVLTALLEVIPLYLEEGKIVKLGELGSFHLTLRSTAHDSEEEVNARSIKAASIVFRAGKRLKKAVKYLTYYKIKKRGR